MLKEYHEWHCDDEKTCAVVVKSVPDAICGKHETVEGDKIELDYLCDMRMRLNNSEVLVNLGSKLNHLPRNEAAELECLILSVILRYSHTN